jgi:anti-sigma B factor antagonist
MSMKVDLIKHGQDAELKLNGYIDATNANDVDKILSDVVAKFDNVTLDLAKLEYVSSAGLRAFKHAYMELRRKGGVLEAKNVSKAVMEVFELTGFTRLFKFL